MSRNKIRVGRYSKERLNQKEQKLMEFNLMKNELLILQNVPEPDWLLFSCSNFFGTFKRMDFRRKIVNFNQSFTEAKHALTNGLFPRDEYLVIFDAIGIEIDERVKFLTWIGSIAEVFIKNLLVHLLELPGLKEMGKDDLSNKIQVCDEFCVLLLFYMFIKETHTDKVIVDINGYELVIEANFLKNLTDDEFFDCHNRLSKTLESIKPTCEELTLLYITSMYQPTKGNAKLSKYYDGIVLTLTKYLQETYGENYHHRLLQLVNLKAQLKERKVFIKSWRKTHRDYVEHIHRNEFVRVWLSPDNPKKMEVLKKYISEITRSD